MKNMQEIKTDVLVIGGGAAGCWAAITASAHGGDVTLINKYPLGKSGTTIVGMITYNAVMGELGVHPEDSPDIYFQDLVKEGALLGDQNLMEIFVRQGRKTVLQLEKMGVRWDKIGDKFDARRLPGMSYPRGCFSDHRTGLFIQRALVREIQKRSNIRVLERKITKLLTKEGRIVGAVGLHIHDGSFLKISAKSVVIATGGAGRLFKITSMPEDARGDGYSLAYEAGARLIDMEFHLFFPATLVYPETLRGLVVPRGTTVPLGARILNGRKERFMHKYYPEAEFATRDKASISIFKEIKSGAITLHGGVYMDVSAVENLLEKYPTSFKDFKDAGMNLPEEWLEIAPGLHFTLGGIQINEFCETSLPGLYAAGEAAGNMHGANRIGGSALPECSVFGQIAGENAAIHAKFNHYLEPEGEQIGEEKKRLSNLLDAGKKGHTRPIEIMRALQDLMYDKVGVLRTGNGLREAIAEIQDLKKKAKDMKIHPSSRYNNEWVDAVDILDMLQLGEIAARSAMFREESRGAHYREDFPQQDDRIWRKHSLSWKEGGDVRIAYCPVRITRPEGG
jgi:fumarate reductase (CoM/CoB) subunit A